MWGGCETHRTQRSGLHHRRAGAALTQEAAVARGARRVLTKPPAGERRPGRLNSAAAQLPSPRDTNALTEPRYSGQTTRPARTVAARGRHTCAYRARSRRRRARAPRGAALRGGPGGSARPGTKGPRPPLATRPARGPALTRWSCGSCAAARWPRCPAAPAPGPAGPRRARGCRRAAAAAAPPPAAPRPWGRGGGAGTRSGLAALGLCRSPRVSRLPSPPGGHHGRGAEPRPAATPQDGEPGSRHGAWRPGPPPPPPRRVAPLCPASQHLARPAPRRHRRSSPRSRRARPGAQCAGSALPEQAGRPPGGGWGRAGAGARRRRGGSGVPLRQPWADLGVPGAVSGGPPARRRRTRVRAPMRGSCGAGRESHGQRRARSRRCGHVSPSRGAQHYISRPPRTSRPPGAPRSRPSSRIRRCL